MEHYLTCIRVTSAEREPEFIARMVATGIDRTDIPCDFCGEMCIHSAEQAEMIKADLLKREPDAVLKIRCLPCTLKADPNWTPTIADPQTVQKLVKVFSEEGDSFDQIKRFLLQVTSVPFREQGIPPERYE